jgi:hypothetical protein
MEETDEKVCGLYMYIVYIFYLNLNDRVPAPAFSRYNKPVFLFATLVVICFVLCLTPHWGLSGSIYLNIATYSPAGEMASIRKTPVHHTGNEYLIIWPLPPSVPVCMATGYSSNQCLLSYLGFREWGNGSLAIRI